MSELINFSDLMSSNINRISISEEWDKEYGPHGRRELKIYFLEYPTYMLEFSTEVLSRAGNTLKNFEVFESYLALLKSKSFQEKFSNILSADFFGFVSLFESRLKEGKENLLDCMYPERKELRIAREKISILEKESKELKDKSQNLSTSLKNATEAGAGLSTANSALKKILLSIYDVNESAGSGSRKKVRELVEKTINIEEVRERISQDDGE